MIGDVNSDGRADLVAINDADIWVALSTGTAFTTPKQWSAVALHGTAGNMLGDVNSDGRADLVAINYGDIWVTLSTGTAFDAPTKWPSVVFQGPVARLP
jgi:hypothetical protein